MRWFVLLFLLLVAGCTSAADPPAKPVPSAWGEVLTIAHTPQLHAPAFWSTGDISAFAWIESDSAGVHQDVRFLNDKGLTAPLALPLSPVRPDRLMLLPVGDDSLLFYLDAAPSGETRLYSAVFGLDQQLKAGPTPVSTTRTEAYTLLRGADGTVWVIWTGGSPAEPGLYAQEIDQLGRARPSQLITVGAKFPTTGTVHNGRPPLYWLNTATNQIYRASFDQGQLLNPQVLTHSIRLEAGERLINFSTAQDSTHGYLFWNTVKADGTPQTWFTAGGLEAENWFTPVLLRIALSETADFVTGYNGGMGFRAQMGTTPLTWAAPAVGQSELLPVAAQLDKQLAIIYFQAGTIVGYQPVFQLEQNLIGLPALQTDFERHLMLAWAAPESTGEAALQWTTTRPLN